MMIRWGIEAGCQGARHSDASIVLWGRLLDLGTALADQVIRSPRLSFQATVKGESGMLSDRAHLAPHGSGSRRGGPGLAFERPRSAVSDVGRWPAGMAVDYRFRRGVGLSRFGQITRACEAWTEALALAREYDLMEWCLRLEERLKQDPAESQADGPIVPSKEVPPVIAEIAT